MLKWLREENKKSPIQSLQMNETRKKSGTVTQTNQMIDIYTIHEEKQKFSIYERNVRDIIN